MRSGLTFTTQSPSLLWFDPLGNTNKWKTGHLHSAQHHSARRGAAVLRAELSDYASPSQGTPWDNAYIKWPILLLLFYTIKSHCARLFQKSLLLLFLFLFMLLLLLLSWLLLLLPPIWRNLFTVTLKCLLELHMG